ncbi:MAG: hypothetical protein OER80_06770 [Gammaproteobacteria bacterium]|nr:hypothetical protein [Gammaproteobacteria bacterium]
MEQKRSVEHYRDHELVCDIRPDGNGWSYTIHVLGHDGDTDRLRCEECSAERYATDLEALHAGQLRSRMLVDRLLDNKEPG